MAFSTGTAATINALLTALDTFAVANGWTQDELSTGSGEAAWHRNNVWVSMKWATSSPTNLSIYQALGYGGTPGAGTDDSGNGYNGPSAWSDANAALERCVFGIGNGPFTYWFFEQDVYLHVVVEVSADVFAHFGFGTIVKTGDWTGGEYCYGHRKTTNGPTGVLDTLLLDGLFTDTTSTNEQRAATLRLQGLPNQVASGKWGQVWGASVGQPLDTTGVAKVNIQGGFRAGPTATPWGRYSAGSGSGGIPMYPIELYYRDVANARVYYLGYQPDVRGVNVRFFAARQVVTIGSDSWYLFPSQQKSTGSTPTGTNNQGIAYRRDNG